MLRLSLIGMVCASLALANAEGCLTAGSRASLDLSYNQASGLLEAKWRANPVPDTDHTAIVDLVDEFTASDPLPADLTPLLELLDAIGKNFWRLTGMTAGPTEEMTLTFTFTEESPNHHGYRTIWAHALYSRHHDSASEETRYSMISWGERSGSSPIGAADLYARLFPEFEALPDGADPFLATLDMFGLLWGYQLDGHGRLETPELILDVYVMRRWHDSKRSANPGDAVAGSCPQPETPQSAGG